MLVDGFFCGFIGFHFESDMEPVHCGGSNAELVGLSVLIDEEDGNMFTVSIATIANHVGILCSCVVLYASRVVEECITDEVHDFHGGEDCGCHEVNSFVWCFFDCCCC